MFALGGRLICLRWFLLRIRRSRPRHELCKFDHKVDTFMEVHGRKGRVSMGLLFVGVWQAVDEDGLLNRSRESIVRELK